MLKKSIFSGLVTVAACMLTAGFLYAQDTTGDSKQSSTTPEVITEGDDSTVERSVIFETITDAPGSEKNLLEKAEKDEDLIDEIVGKENSNPVEEEPQGDDSTEDPSDEPIDEEAPAEDDVDNDNSEEVSESEAETEAEPAPSETPSDLKDKVRNIKLKPGQRQTDEYLKQLDQTVNSVMSTKIEKKEPRQSTKQVKVRKSSSDINQFLKFSKTSINETHNMTRKIAFERIAAKCDKDDK